jgi:peptide/nickel transport system permease protein
MVMSEKQLIKRRKGTSRFIKILRNAGMIIPMIIMGLLVFCAIFAPWISPYPYAKTVLSERKLPPAWIKANPATGILAGSTKHLLGTDTLGRDILSRVIYGARTSLSVSLLAIAITAIIGTFLGILSGYLGGKWDSVIMRICDVAMSFPGLLMAVLLAVSLGPGFMTVVFALSILGWAGYARILRGEALRIRTSEYVQQARIVGAPAMRIMFKHIFPNVMNTLLVGVTLSVGGMILGEAAFSYLGIGIPQPMPSWGSMVADGRVELIRCWWISLFPGILIGLVVLSGNFLGDWLRDKLDPRLRQI